MEPHAHRTVHHGAWEVADGGERLRAENAERDGVDVRPLPDAPDEDIVGIVAGIQEPAQLLVGWCTRAKERIDLVQENRWALLFDRPEQRRDADVRRLQSFAY